MLEAMCWRFDRWDVWISASWFLPTAHPISVFLQQQVHLSSQIISELLNSQGWKVHNHSAHFVYLEYLRVKVKDTMFPYMFPFSPSDPSVFNEPTPRRSALFVAEHHLFSCHCMSSLFHPTMGGLWIPNLAGSIPPFWQDRYPSSVDKNTLNPFFYLSR